MRYTIHGLVPEAQVPPDIGPGFEIRVQVERIDPARREVRLRFIELLADESASEAWRPYSKGQLFEGRIKRIRQDLRFILVQVTDGTTGILPLAKMSPQLRERFLRQELQTGDSVAVELVEVDALKRRLVFRGLEAPSYKSIPRRMHSYGALIEKLAPGLEQVQFTTYSPLNVLPVAWNSLLAYCHLPEALMNVEEDSRSHLGQAGADFQKSSTQNIQMIAREVEIVIEPSIEGCRFNPPRASIVWLEGWHRLEFRFQALPKLPGFALGVPLSGRVLFFVGPVLVGETGFRVQVSETADFISQRPDIKTTAGLYQSIFVSYSHQDYRIVDGLERAYQALGNEYLRDVRSLRSGEKWQPKLLEMIEKADIFQLCWSQAAKRSRNVKQEWRHALEQRRCSFIRPMYWEIPMPKPPAELAKLQFHYYPLE
jgi:TIR domain-containing protein